MPALQAGAGGRISPRDVGRRDPLLGTSKARLDWYPDVARSKGAGEGGNLRCPGCPATVVQLREAPSSLSRRAKGR